MLYKIKTCAITIATVFACLLLTSKSSFAQDYSCFPTCSATDMRFFVFAGPGLSSFIDTKFVFAISSPASSRTLEIGIFDGDDSEGPGAEEIAPGVFITDWDQGGAANIIATLYADPQGLGEELIQIARWSGDGSLGDNLSNPMPDNDWFTRTLNNIEAARSANGNFRYTLVIETIESDVGSQNQFKIRTDGSMVILPGNEFAFSSMWISFDDSFIAWPNLTNEDFTDPACVDPITNRFVCGMLEPGCCIAGGPYDGSWKYYVQVPDGEKVFNIWDGDFDFGSASFQGNTCVDPDGVDVDTDDWNTPPGIPDFAQGTGAVPQGALPADPADDGCFLGFQFPPSVNYNIISPLNQVFQNDNPSASQEWELFNIGNEGDVDFQLDSIPGGIWTMMVMGLDWVNLNGLRFDHPVLAVNENDEPVPFDEPEFEAEVPTLNQWGIIAMASILGILGLLAIRKRKVTT